MSNGRQHVAGYALDFAFLGARNHQNPIFRRNIVPMPPERDQATFYAAVFRDVAWGWPEAYDVCETIHGQQSAIDNFVSQ